MRILVVDDDPDIRTLAIRALRQEFGRDPEISEIADQANLDQALAGKAPLDLLVTDYSLGWSDGFAVLAAVRAAYPGCAAVMFTGTGNEELAVRALKAGFDDYVVKSARQFRRLAAACRVSRERACALRAHEENRDLLTQELYHRLHNNLQLVISLMTFTARAVNDPDARSKIEDLSRRVRSLALLQEQIYQGRDWRNVDFKAFLTRLVDDLIALDPRLIAVSAAMDEAPLRIDLAVPLGLIANEVLTNALRHAFSDGAEGRIEVGLSVRDSGELLLEIADDGIGFSAMTGEGMSAGSGQGLIHRLAQQIRAMVTYQTDENGGTRCRVVVPV